MPVVAVNIVKVLFVLALYGFLFYVARAMRGHVSDPRVVSSPTPTRRTVHSDRSPPPAPRRAALEVHPSSGAEPRTMDVVGRMVMGRSDSADITIDDEYASDRHAAFEFDGTALTVEDLGSTNGTRIGDTRITQKTALEAGTEIVVGRTRVVAR